MVEESDAPEPPALVGSPPQALSGRIAATTAAIAMSLDFLGMGGTFRLAASGRRRRWGLAEVRPWRNGCASVLRPRTPGETTIRSTSAPSRSRQHRQHGDEQGAGEHPVVLVDAQPVDEQPAEAAEPDVRRDGGGRAHLQRRAAQAADDQRQRHRHLGPEQHLHRAHAHPDARRPRPTGRPSGCRRTSRRGSVARPAARARSAPGRVPMPISVTIRISRPKVGSARPALPMLMARNAPRLVCPISSPIGSAMTALIATASRVYDDVLEQPVRDRRGLRPGPVGPVEEVAEVVEHRDDGHQRAPARVQGVIARCSSTRPRSHDERQQHREQDADRRSARRSRAGSRG